MKVYKIWLLLIACFVMAILCNSCTDTKKAPEKIKPYPKGEYALFLHNYQQNGFTYTEALDAIRIAYPSYHRCIGKLTTFSEKYILTERCKCQIKHLPEPLWSMGALRYELGHTTDLLNECISLCDKKQ